MTVAMYNSQKHQKPPKYSQQPLKTTQDSQKATKRVRRCP